MEVGIGSGLSIKLGMERDVLERKLRDASEQYELYYDKIDKQGIRQTVFVLKRYSIELDLEDDILKAVIMPDNKLNHLGHISDIDETNLLKKLSGLSTILENMLGVSGVEIDRLNFKPIQGKFKFEDQDGVCFSLDVQQDGSGNIYLRSIRLLN